MASDNGRLVKCKKFFANNKGFEPTSLLAEPIFCFVTFVSLFTLFIRSVALQMARLLRGACIVVAVVGAVFASPPPDWQARINAGQMAYSAEPPATIGPDYYPVVGNGFIGLEAGPFVLPFSISNQTDCGSLKLSGLYSGYNYSTPSHRAQVPRVSGVTLVSEPGATYVAVGVAIDWGAGVYYNRTLVVNGTAGRCDNTLIEQRLYAHQQFRELLVLELYATAGDASPTWAGCTLPVSWPLAVGGLGDTVLNETRGSASTPTLWTGTTALPEEPGLPVHVLALAFDTWVAESPMHLTFTPALPSLVLHAVLRSDLDVGVGATPTQVAAAAAASWSTYAAMTPAALLASHESAWADLWASGGIELQGNASFAASVNASLYDILSSLRDDWNWCVCVTLAAF
jgi:protein-glucosylgalactosylhydroxylysine glucosidase